MWLLVNHIKPTNTLYWNYCLLTADNHKSARGQLQNNSINGAISITIKRVIIFGFNMTNKRHTLILLASQFFQTMSSRLQMRIQDLGQTFKLECLTKNS